MELLLWINSEQIGQKRREVLDKINSYYKDKLNVERFDICDSGGFIQAFKDIKSIGDFSILLQFVTFSYTLYRSVLEIERDRGYYLELIKFMLANTGKPLYPDIDSFYTFNSSNKSYYYSYHDKGNVELLSSIARLQLKLCPDLGVDLSRPRSLEQPSGLKKIKVGFVSDLVMSTHSVAKDRLGIIKSLYIDPEFKVKIITRTTKTDDFFNQVVFKDIKCQSIFLKLESDSLKDNRTAIANERFDILVYPEIGMCAKTRLLAMSRLAPVQVTTWGHSETSGIQNIDYFISSRYFNSISDQNQYSEKLVLFDSLGTYYYNIVKLLNIENVLNPFAKAGRQPCDIESPHIYGCLQVYLKMHPSFIDILNKIQDQDPSAVLIIINNDENGSYENYLKSSLRHFNRVLIVNQQPINRLFEIMKCCDVLLDFYPFGGFNSTIEAFALGKIVITMTANRISGKFTTGLYRKMGISEFITKNQKEYVEKAIRYASNPEMRLEYEQRILENLDKIYQEPESITEWKTFLKSKCKS